MTMSEERLVEIQEDLDRLARHFGPESLKTSIEPDDIRALVAEVVRLRGALALSTVIHEIEHGMTKGSKGQR
jgi:hypothetical protein